MMRLLKFFMICAMGMSLALSACGEEGPTEKAGKKVDETVEEMGDTMEDVGDTMGKKAEEVTR